MKWKDNDLAVLQHLETSIARVWRDHPDMTDYAAQRAYEAAYQFYRAVLRGHQPKPHGLDGVDATAFEALKAMCDYLLGHGPCPIEGLPKAPAIALEQLPPYLRELDKSVQRHTKISGRQGYLSFIQQFLP